MTLVPLVIYRGGERTVIGHCDVKHTERGEWELSGEITSDDFKSWFRENQFNPNWYSVEYLLPDFEPQYVAFVPPLAIPSGRVKFTGVIPPLSYPEKENDG